MNVQTYPSDGHYFWSHTFDIENSTTCYPEPEGCHIVGGYIGLQVGSAENNTKVARFSIWAATAATPSTASGSACRTFDGEGTGYTCRIDPFNWVAGHPYETKVTKGTSSASGTWWIGSIRDTITGVTTPIGSILVPPTWGNMRSVYSFTEYFGSNYPSCAAVLPVTATFSAPTAQGGSVVGGLDDGTNYGTNATPGCGTGPNRGSYVAPGSTSHQHFMRPTGGSLTGTVRNAQGNVVGGATVSVGGFPMAVTAPNGTYSIDQLVRTSYSVQGSSLCKTSNPQTVNVGGAAVANITLTDAPTCAIDPQVWETTSTKLSLTGDDAVEAVPLPFAYSHYGTNYSTGYVSTNGYLSFISPTQANYANTSLPNTSEPNAAIYPFWDDLMVDASAGVWVSTLGTAPQRRFVIEWRNVAPLDLPAQRFSFQVVLYEDRSQRVRLQYKAIDAGTRETGTEASIGKENAAGDRANLVGFNNGVLYDGLSIRPK